MNQDIKLVIDQLDQVELTDDNTFAIANTLALLETLGNKVAEQAAVIEKLSNSIRFDSYNMSLAEWKIICEVVNSAKTDSKQILIDWMREQLGEPVDFRSWEWLEDNRDVPLFKQPEILK